MIIRNDDVAVDTDIENIMWFCSLCDKYGIKIIHAITPVGKIKDISVFWTNDEIKEKSGNSYFIENKEVFSFLKNRKDMFGVHGLYHTHKPTKDDVLKGKKLLEDWGLKPFYFIPPFNEGDYPNNFCGLKTLGKIERLEDFLDEGKPSGDIVYLHSWRFGSWYSKEKLEICLKNIML